MNKGSSAKIILIVEDEFDNREIMRMVVEDLLGYTAISVSDGESALQAISERIPDLILMDLMMPVLDGFEVIKRIKSTPETARIPVLVVSALSRPIDRERALATGADDYLGKPFDIEHLTSMIEHYVSSV
jgi:two-component system, OmpR family, phosphate regulon response regulator PhoB